MSETTTVPYVARTEWVYGTGATEADALAEMWAAMVPEPGAYRVTIYERVTLADGEIVWWEGSWDRVLEPPRLP